MRMKILASAATVLSLVASPVLAQSAASSNPAAALSVAKSSSVRASTKTGKSSKIAPGAWAAVVGALAIGAGAIILATDGDEDSDSA